MLSHMLPRRSTPENCNPIISMLAQEGITALVGVASRIMADLKDDLERSCTPLWCLAVRRLARESGRNGASSQALPCRWRRLRSAACRDARNPKAVARARPHDLEAAASRLEALRVATGANDPTKRIYDLSRSLGLPASLSEIGFGEENIERAATLALEELYLNPRQFDEIFDLGHPARGM